MILVLGEQQETLEEGGISEKEGVKEVRSERWEADPTGPQGPG